MEFGTDIHCTQRMNFINFCDFLEINIYIKTSTIDYSKCSNSEKSVHGLIAMMFSYDAVFHHVLHDLYANYFPSHFVTFCFYQYNNVSTSGKHKNCFIFLISISFPQFSAFSFFLCANFKCA